MKKIKSSRTQEAKPILSPAYCQQCDPADAISKKIASDYKKRTGLEPTLFVSRPGKGATVIKG